jgi:NAD(P)H-hydrate repair Nnr-like enzyme with NAD(P)H-hydrate dehydratase domain
LATAGSGDVKAGIVAGLMARGASPDQAAVWGAWAHGRAGERLEGDVAGYLARDLTRAAPAALAEAEGADAAG